ncbi:MAG: hypothetical protein NVS9B3_08610 [Gemmatimonadaceae bacterium]
MPWGMHAVAMLIAAIAPSGRAVAAPSYAVDDSSATRIRRGTGERQRTPFGRSGKLRARVLGPTGARMPIGALTRLFGDSTGDAGSFRVVHDSATGRSLSLIPVRPFAAKAGQTMGKYRLGFWPEEVGRVRSDAYANPSGFIEVTQRTQDTRVSEHFSLRDFLTHDQHDVWPKYLVLRDELVDKLELVLADLRAHGHAIDNPIIMSGFRTPEYNARGVGARGGRARDSRHQFGDAADLLVGPAVMGRRGHGRDRRRRLGLRAVLASVERVESAYPELVGGVGLYPATRQHGPFVHIDVRGKRARWGHA